MRIRRAKLLSLASAFLALPAATLAAQSTPPPLVVPGSRQPPDPRFHVPIRRTVALGCRGGNQDMCIDFAHMMQRGLGGPRQPREAQALLKRVCRNGYTRVCGMAARTVR